MPTETIVQHTPGPWEVYEGHDGHFRHEPYVLVKHPKARGAAICRLIDCGVPNTADARLIAAAPDMLAVLEQVRRVSDLGNPNKLLPSAETLQAALIDLASLADAAIAKARGA